MVAIDFPETVDLDLDPRLRHVDPPAVNPSAWPASIANWGCLGHGYDDECFGAAGNIRMTLGLRDEKDCRVR